MSSLNSDLMATEKEEDPEERKLKLREQAFIASDWSDSQDDLESLSIRMEYAKNLQVSIRDLCNTILQFKSSQNDRSLAQEAILKAQNMKGEAGANGADSLRDAMDYVEETLKALCDRKLDGHEEECWLIVDRAAEQASLDAEVYLETLLAEQPAAGVDGSEVADELKAQRGISAIPREEVKVLLVEDNKTYARLLKATLSQAQDMRFTLTWVDTLAAAMTTLTTDLYHVILLDMSLPDSSAPESFDRVRRQAPEAPIIVLTASDDKELALEAIKRGAQDYLVKQRMSHESVERCIRYAIERKKTEESTLRLEAIEDFMGTLAHDLQVPMIGADRALDILLSGKIGELGDRQAEVISQLKSSNDKALRLVQRLLEVYRYESLRDSAFEMVDVRSMINTLISEFRQQIEMRGLRVETSFPTEMKKVPAERRGLKLLFLNLLDNAIKYSPPGQRIDIWAAMREDCIVVNIANRGEGINLGARRHLFKHLWHGVPGKKYVAGTGLGLYLCKRIVDLHSGTISCDSTASITTLTVTLPFMKLR